MNTPRRSFILSLVAAVATAPIFCRFRNLIQFGRTIVRPPLELWEMTSDWDGTLSPHFLAKYGLISYSEYYALIGEKEPSFEPWKYEAEEEFDYDVHLDRIRAQFENASLGCTPEQGSFVAAVFTERL